MPRVDFSNTPDAQSFATLPDGHYDCVVEKCTERTTAAGDTQFSIEFKVLGGEFKDRKIFDSILFQLGNPEGGAMRRTKLVLSRLGFVVERAFSVEPQDLNGRKVIVTCDGIEKYQDKEGKDRVKNLVPFDGYTKHGDQRDDKLPF